MRKLVLLGAFVCCGTLPARAQFGDEICKSMNQGKFSEAQRGQGDPQTIFCAGFWYKSGTGVQKDPKTAANYYRRAAESGYSPAQDALGLLYASGTGVPQDNAEALAWFRKAASQGDADAQNNLGTMYSNGQGVPKDLNEAARWYRLAVANGSARAANNLVVIEMAARPQRKEPAQDLWDEASRLYHAGNKAAAMKPLMTAAQAGNSTALYELGWLYEHGDGVPQNSAEAAKWYRKSADLGNADAEANLGLFYEERIGVQEDWVAATKLYQEAVDQNNAVGQSQLARAYLFGIGVPQNRKMAVWWNQRAAALDDGDAAYWAKWLTHSSNNMAVLSREELAYVPHEPVGIVFHNSAERMAFVRKWPAPPEAVNQAMSGDCKNSPGWGLCIQLLSDKTLHIGVYEPGYKYGPQYNRPQ